ncbi:RRQRL motif-containing zinc-binding protein [Streptomyces xiamenensis]
MSTLPTYAPRCAPDGLMTVRQLRAAGLRPGGHAPVAQIVWPRSGRWAALYEVTKALPVRPMTPGRWHAVAAMMIANSTCPKCGEVRDHYYSRRLGCCGPCAAADLEQAA